MKNLNIILLIIISINVNAGGGPIPIGSQFSYQGELQDAGAPATGMYDMVFSLHTSAGSTNATASMQIDDIEVTNGLFNVVIDFGDAPFDGQEYYLEIHVKKVVDLAFSLLAPKQRINAVPYAIQSEFVENGSSPWLDAFTGVQYNGDVVIGDLIADAGDTLQVVSDTGDSPLRVIVDTQGTRFRVSKNGGTGIGQNYSDGQIPDNGLRVSGDTRLNGDLIQDLGNHGAIKAGVVIQCGAGLNGGSERFFNNVNGTDFTTTQNGAGGGCSITVPFTVDNLFYAVSADKPSGPFVSRNGSCVTHATENKLTCQISEVSSAGVTSTNGVLQILFY